MLFSTTEDQAARHRFVAKVLHRHRYFKLRNAHRGVLFAYMQRLTGYTRQHLTKLVGRYRQEHHLHPLTRASRTSFKSRFGPEDIALLADLDVLHNTLSGPATKVLLRRAWQSFGDTRYAKLAAISVSHLYNLRASTDYRKQRTVWSRTRPAPVKIGLRKAPAPQGLPDRGQVAPTFRRAAHQRPV